MNGLTDKAVYKMSHTQSAWTSYKVEIAECPGRIEKMFDTSPVLVIRCPDWMSQRLASRRERWQNRFRSVQNCRIKILRPSGQHNMPLIGGD
jgi:hypothetical protein